MVQVKLVIIIYLYIMSGVSSIITSIDFQPVQFREQMTDQFYADGSGLSNIIVRRGNKFRFTVQMNERLASMNIEVQLTFITNKDKMLISLPGSQGWNIKQTVTDEAIFAIISIPAFSPVGKWSVKIVLKNNVTTMESFDVPNDLIILFNPWSKADDVYFPVKNKLNEYLLSENGFIYQYDWNEYVSIPWIFGQPIVLTAVLYALQGVELAAADRGDIVKVSRKLTAV
ncbi:protein-glutamine gamma-glutamyltransferase 2-like protein, partial [Leptotrombidium deliense]